MPKLNWRYGEGHPKAKLCDDDVREIRQLWLAGMTNQAIGDLYGVSGVSIGNIINGNTWAHVTHAAVCFSDDIQNRLDQA